MGPPKKKPGALVAFCRVCGQLLTLLKTVLDIIKDFYS